MTTPPQSPVAAAVPVAPKNSPHKPIPVRSPIDHNENSVHPYGLESDVAKYQYWSLAQEAKKFMIGPMPVEEFINEFLPPPPRDHTNMPDPLHAFRRVPQSASKKEAEIYEPLITALSSRCPGYTFADTSGLSEHHGQLGYIRPAVCLYADNCLEIVANAKGEYPANFGYTELFIEVKGDAEADDFCTDPGALMETQVTDDFVLGFKNQKNVNKRMQWLGQNVAYAVAMFARQHRAFFFSVWLCGSWARLLRWDHAGLTVSASFDLRAQPDLLCKFFWRFAHANDEARGYDTTVRLATDDEEELFENGIARHIVSQRGLTGTELQEAVSDHYEAGTVYAVQVVEKNGDCHYVLVSRPVISPLSVASRATRGFWGIDADSGRICFLKDTWRYNDSTSETEGDILESLHKKDVRNVPQLLYHGDVAAVSHPAEVQRTKTDQFLNGAQCIYGGQSQIMVIPRIHYRIALATVGYPLRTFSGTKELLHIAYNAYEAILDAFKKCNRLHRDISLDNILMIKGEGTAVQRGILIDWELSCGVNNQGEARHYERTGTWQFMSVKLLRARKSFAHTIQDDMESMLYVVLYCSMRWLPHNQPNNVYRIIDAFFNERLLDIDMGTSTGGSSKLANQTDRATTDEFQWVGPIHRWLNTVMSYCKPLPDDGPEFQGKWRDPTPLKDYWEQFLQGNELPADDRTRFATLPQALVRPLPALIISSFHESSKHSSTKRDAEDDLEDSARESKRPHVASQQEIAQVMQDEMDGTNLLNAAAGPSDKERGK